MANYVYIATSLDGFIATPDGGLDWLMEIPNSDRLWLCGIYERHRCARYGAKDKNQHAPIFRRGDFNTMDYQELTAPCGLFCGVCPLYQAQENAQLRAGLANKLGWSEDDAQCRGCRASESLDCPVIRLGGTCGVYSCIQEKGLHNCSECEDFPCDHLQPYADKASEVPHNTKVFNLCLIQKMGMEKWAREKAAKVLKSYFEDQWRL